MLEVLVFQFEMEVERSLPFLDVSFGDQRLIGCHAGIGGLVVMFVGGGCSNRRDMFYDLCKFALMVVGFVVLAVEPLRLMRSVMPLGPGSVLWIVMTSLVIK
jgi:hypothetical protein